MSELIVWVVFGGYIGAAILYLVVTSEDTNGKQQH